MSRIGMYLRTASSNTSEVRREIDEQLWTEIDPTSFDNPAVVAYQSALADQYRLYVEMADRVSARRATANSFFLSINTVIFSLVAVFWERRPDAPTWLLLFPLVAVLVQCAAWFWIVRSYRQLNSGKYAVIRSLEARLPASPFGKGEWVALGEGRDPSRYWPLTRIEGLVPLLFALSYTGAFLAALLA